ncbi:MAG: cadmium-translocating P-type ATPase [Clostridia bacterium]|jgi:Cd2+/Zn2+-exporting ATPase|nr:cadmium-translocating P-type ATPase [Clostridia bacterium]
MGCKHCHEHEGCKIEHMHTEEKKENNRLGITLYIIAIVLLAVSFIIQERIIQTFLIGISVIFSGYKLLASGIKNILRLNFEEDTLMTIAVLAAFCLGEYIESSMVVILYRLGEFLEDRAVDKSQKSMKEILKIKANIANKINKNNEIEKIDVEEIQVGDIILIKPGEKIPVDALIISGSSNIDTSAITGESKQQYVERNTEILSGGINLTGVLTCKVIRDSKNSTASQIINLVYEAKNNKGNTEKFITKFSKTYTPTVIILAIILAILPASLGILDYKTWITRGLIFLVASCPCSLVIAVPLSFFSCVGAISKKGIIIKGTKHIENISKTTTIAFDKTGTLTTGKMEINELVAFSPYTKEEILKYMYSLEKMSNHPISTAIEKYTVNLDMLKITEYKEIAGHGIYGKIEEKEVVFGNLRLLNKYKVKKEDEIPEDAIYMAIEGKIAGYITLKEQIRTKTKELIEQLEKIGIKNIIMLTGDNKKSAEKIKKQLKIKRIKAELLPQDKLEEITKIKEKGEKVIFVGDGINDSPVLAASDFGIAMGEGSQIAASTADGILLSNNISILPEIIKISKRSMNIIKFNIIFSLTIKILVLILGAMGKAPIWSAILADTGVTFLTVLNSMRIFKM